MKLKELKQHDMSELSLGFSPARAYGCAIDAIPVIAMHEETPNLPYYTDSAIYRTQRGLMAGRQGEVILSITIPGQEAYLRERGFLQGVEVIDLKPQTAQGEPTFDVLKILGSQGAQFSDRHVLVPVLPSEEVTAQGRSLGMTVLPFPSINITNDKVVMSADSEAFGFNVLPRHVIHTQDDINDAVRRFSDAKFGVWMKYPLAAGGLGVVHINAVTEESIKAEIAKMRKKIAAHYEANDSSEMFSEFWPAGAAAPKIGLVLELDWNNLGTPKYNYCTHVLVSGSGKVELLENIAMVTTPKGKYLGSTPCNVDDEIWEVVEPHLAGFSRASMAKGYRGIINIDWSAFTVHSRSYGIEPGIYPAIVDPNARPGGASPPMIAANILGAGQNWMLLKLEGPKPINTINDFIQTVGRDLATGDPHKGGLVLPQTMEPGSPVFRVVVMGESHEHVNHILNKQLLDARRAEVLTD